MSDLTLAEAAEAQGFTKTYFCIAKYTERAADALVSSRPREVEGLLAKAIVHADTLPRFTEHPDAPELSRLLRGAREEIQKGRHSFGLLGHDAAHPHFAEASALLAKAIVAAPPPPFLPPIPPAVHGAAWHATQTPRIHPTEHSSAGDPFVKLGPDTKDLHSEGGVYTPERQALHQQIMHHFLSGSDHGAEQPVAEMHEHYRNPQVQPDAVFSSGGAGSGKSHYAKRKFLKHPRFVSIDPDAIKEHLANAEGKPGDHNTNASHYHEESSDIAKHLQTEAHRQRKSYVLDGTGANPKSMAAKMQAARDAGYRVHLHYANVPFETALQRDAGRKRSLQNLPGGREAMETQHARVRQGFSQVRGLAHKVRVFDSTEDQISQYRKQREAKSKQMEKALVKGMKKVTLHPHNHYLIGTITNGNLHVHDVVHHGNSEHMITGSRSRLRAIPMSDLKLRFPGLTIEDHKG